MHAWCMRQFLGYNRGHQKKTVKVQGLLKLQKIDNLTVAFRKKKKKKVKYIINFVFSDLI